MGDVTLTINDTTVTVSEGSTILEAAAAADVYIPTLCYHPSLPTSKGLEPKEFIFRGEEKSFSEGADAYEGCRLCIVEVAGMDEFQTACNTPVR